MFFSKQKADILFYVFMRYFVNFMIWINTGPVEKNFSLKIFIYLTAI